MPLLSVVVPFYNVEAYLEQCLVSLRDQLLQDIEVVLVDDGSPDGSLAIAERFVAADPRFRLVRQDNAGLGPARNTGVAHATGRYLAFVDSDDVVPPRAYTALVGTLEQTGSDLAGGNAYRFSADRGVYQSWTHADPFAETVLRTTLDRTVILTKDRMAWNKVYRRSFWDEHGLAFPAIKYEDYPVTLRAYLEASSVDVLADHVYFWRDRESGDSITQQVADLGNARERFESARMVLDVLAHHDANSAVRQAVQGYFVHVDLVSLCLAMVAVPPADRPAVEGMAVELARLLPASAGADATHIARLLHRSLLAGDLPLARSLARWRLGGGGRALATEFARRPRPAALPLLAGAVVRSGLRQNPLGSRLLRATLQDARWDGDRLLLTVRARIRGSFAGRVRASASAGGLPVTVEAVRPAGHAVLVDLTVGGLDHLEAPAALHLTLRAGPLRWAGPVTFDAQASTPGIHRVGDHWVDLVEGEDGLQLTRVADPVVVRASAEGSRFTLRPATGSGMPAVVQRPAPTPDLPLDLDGTTEATTLVAGDPPDDPVTGSSQRPVLLADGRPVRLTGAPATVRAGADELSLTRDTAGGLVLRRARRLRDAGTPAG
ncbi:glycosyltransferase [Calidifontibacter sp. DB0510]|uniref:Glycosyltransferase n=1 Tax=Metallococcus carri TaxID=1656884 RepID=A0A967E8W4_9MICO|nr:glycosyltransferase [Metallococcus carri]NHN54600.1 glycosyltransferase [Metallococcus carri]NOP36561.1 glycosyltransferase [Calidifontibacter sp. DB2511S]